MRCKKSLESSVVKIKGIKEMETKKEDLTTEGE